MAIAIGSKALVPGLMMSSTPMKPIAAADHRLQPTGSLRNKAAPAITANAYGTDHDVQEMLAAVKYLRRLAAQKPLADLIDAELRPGPECRTDADLIGDFRARSGTVYHPSCTARMGPDAASAVVDPHLRVHGVSGLRVCDASAFPTLIAGNTNAPAMMMGWRGAAIILADQA